MKLAVLFPGIGYHCDKPLLYYAGKTARQLGYEEIIRISYSYTGGSIRGDEKAMRECFDSLYAQTENALCNVAWEQYEEILFISKSIGTAIAAAYANRHSSDASDAKLHGSRVRHILYTPLKETYLFVPGMEARSSALEDGREIRRSVLLKGIAFIGTSDPWSNTEEVASLSRRAGIPMMVIPDADHSLETGDALRDIQILQQVMEETKVFISGGYGA